MPGTEGGRRRREREGEREGNWCVTDRLPVEVRKGRGGGQALFIRGGVWHEAEHEVYNRGEGGCFGSETHPPPKKILTQNLAEIKSSLNERPIVGPTQTPPLPQ